MLIIVLVHSTVQNFFFADPSGERVLHPLGGGRPQDIQEAPRGQIEHARARESLERRLRHEIC